VRVSADNERVSADKYDTHTVTFTSTGRDATFTIAELYEMQTRHFDLITAAETNKRLSQLAEFDPTTRGLAQVDIYQTAGTLRNVDYFYNPDGFGRYPYGVPLLAFGPISKPTTPARTQLNTPHINQWFMTLSGNYHLVFDPVDWDDEAGLDGLITRVMTADSSALAVEASLTHHITWDDRHDCPWDEITDLLTELQSHEPVDVRAASDALDTHHIPSGGVQLLDPYTLRFVELPQLLAAEIPAGPRVGDVDKLIRAQGLTPIRSTGKSAGLARFPKLRLAAHPDLAKTLPSLDKRVMYWMYNTVYDTGTEQWHRCGPNWDHRPRLNPTPITLQQRNVALAD